MEEPMRLRSVRPGTRVRPVDGIPVGMLRQELRTATAVKHFNGADWIGSYSPSEILRRLGRMADDCVVVVMAENSGRERAFPAHTGMEVTGGVVNIKTHFIY
jgi:hypothetical protein